MEELTDSSPGLKLQIEVSTDTAKNIANIKLNIFKHPDETFRVRTHVQNKDRTMKGLGRALWELSLKLIQKFADERGVSITHEVVKDPYMDLSKDKWDELFSPLLERHRYTFKTRNNPYETWERVYLPHKK